MVKCHINNDGCSRCTRHRKACTFASAKQQPSLGKEKGKIPQLERQLDFIVQSLDPASQRRQSPERPSSPSMEATVCLAACTVSSELDPTRDAAVAAAATDSILDKVACWSSLPRMGDLRRRTRLRKPRSGVKDCMRSAMLPIGVCCREACELAGETGRVCVGVAGVFAPTAGGT